MDGKRFDDLVRWLEMGRSRRTLTRLLGSGALLAPLVALGLGHTAAKGKGKGKGKKKPRKKPVCLCSAAGCQSQKVKKPSKLIAQNPSCNYAGNCTTNPCAAGGPPPGPPGPPGCVPEPQATTCLGVVCGTVRTNNCGQTVTCGCPSGQDCLPNGTCARPCPSGVGQCVDCLGTPVACSSESSEGPRYCFVGDALCANRQPCVPADTTGCPSGFFCQAECFESGHRCQPAAVCPAS